MLGSSLGLPKEKIENLREWRTSDCYNDLEKLVLEYTETLVNDVRVPEELYKRLTEHFTPRQIIVLCITNGISAMINRLHGTFQTDVDEETAALEAVRQSMNVLIK